LLFVIPFEAIAKDVLREGREGGREDVLYICEAMCQLGRRETRERYWC